MAPRTRKHTITEAVGGYKVSDRNGNPVCVVTQNDKFRTWEQALQLAHIIAAALDESAPRAQSTAANTSVEMVVDTAS